MTEINKEIGQRLAKRLAISGKTQADLAAYMNTSQASVSNWVNGVKLPRMDKIDRICEFIGCNRSDILIEAPFPFADGGMTRAFHYYFGLLNVENKEKVLDIMKALLLAQNTEGDKKGV